VSGLSQNRTFLINDDNDPYELNNLNNLNDDLDLDMISTNVVFVLTSVFILANLIQYHGVSSSILQRWENQEGEVSLLTVLDVVNCKNL
jgi:hypothetical protein